MRGTTRSPDVAAELEAEGIEAFVGDPDRVATLTPALEHVSVACLLLGSAVGPHSSLQALHGSRLEMLLTRLIDTTVRGIVYEAAGSIDGFVLADGAARVRAACEDSVIPYAMLEVGPADFEPWLESAVGAIELVLDY